MSLDQPSGRREIHLIQYWNILVKRRRVVAVFAVLMVAVVLIGSLLSTRYYAAAAVLQIDPKAPVVFDVGGVADNGPAATWGPSLKAYYATQYRLMESRTVMREAARRLQEEHGVDDFDDKPSPAMYLRQFVTVKPDPETQLVRIIVEYPDPDKAALFANTIATAYLETKRERSLEDSRQAVRWLADQLDVYRARKIASDETVHRFRFDNALVGADEGRHVTLEALERVQEDWSESHAVRVKREAAYESVVKLRRDEDLLTAATHLARDNPVLQDMLQRYSELEQSRSSLTARYRDQHPEVVKLDTEMAGLSSAIGRQVDRIVDDHRTRLEFARQEEQTLAADLEQIRADVQALGDRLVEFELLKSEAERNEQFYRDLDTRLTEVGISQFLLASNVRQVEDAIANANPVRPRVLVNLVTSLLLGLLGGATLALIFEYFDFNVKSREDIEDMLGIPFLGLIPKVGATQLTALGTPLDQSLFVEHLPRSAVAESLRTIRTHAMFRLPSRERARLLITSTVPREGKSFVSANFAAIVAMANTRVIVIDGDMRRPTLHKLFDVPNDVGLVDVLKGKVSLQEAAHATSLPTLHIVPAGRATDAGEVLDVDKLSAALDSLQGYNLIVIDSPPMSAVADAAIFASVVDGLLYVVEAGRTSRSLARHAVERLQAMNTNFLGAVVNKVDIAKPGYGYGYGYDSYRTYYGEEEDKKEPRLGAANP